jgi:solute:Na+ symporter, SSS family
VLSFILKKLPSWTSGAFPDYPFLDRMTIVFVILVVLMIIISLADPKTKKAEKIIEVDTALFRSTPSFIAGSVLILGILTALYAAFW